MAEYQENWSKLLSISSSENRDSADSSNAEANGRDEEFYEKIEAPKFVDFTVPGHYCPDDRYWFCLRVGCDQKHEEEMDSEAIYKNFVLRVMAARSPNVRLRKALDRNASRRPTKCPHSAPPKSSRPRLSRMDIISSISKKMVDDKKRVVRPLLKPGSTPLTKTKPVAAKYLTTPRNKKSISNQNSFRSVQNPKAVNIEVPKSRIVAKALIFHSPKKTIKVKKTSVELRTPISKLCEGMNKLEISSQKKRALGNSRTCINQKAKSGRSIKSKVKEKLSQPQASKKLLANDHTVSLKNNESHDIKQEAAKKVEVEFGLQESTHQEDCRSPTVPRSTQSSDLASLNDSNEEGESENTRSLATNIEDNNSNDGNGNEITRITSESCGELTDNINVNSSSEPERNGHEFVDSDDKENAAVSDENRMQGKILKQNGRKIFGMHDNCGQVKKKVTQAQDKNLKEGLISSGPVTKLKTTNPKPFRLRTDERRILKEANLERKTDPLAPQSESANLNTLGGKLQRKQGNDNQKGSIIVGLKTQNGKERSKAAASVTPESDNHQKRKVTTSLESNAIQRLEKFRKMKSPIQKQSVRLRQGPASEKNEMTSFLIPGQKLDVIHETSPEVSELRKGGKATAAAHFAASRSSSCGRLPITVATEPNFHSTHIPRTFTKKIK